MKTLIAVAATLIFSPTANAATYSRDVTAQEFGDTWPLTVQAGKLSCTQKGKATPVTFTTPDGKSYAVNGAAASSAADIWAIWRDNPEIEGAKVNIGALIDEGLKLCRS